MRSASMSFLGYSLLLGICLIYSNAGEYFTRTIHNLSAWHDLHPTFHGELSLLSCAMTCGMDRSCLGIGHSMSPNQQCVLFIFKQAGEAGNHSSHHNLTYYLRDDIGACSTFISDILEIGILSVGRPTAPKFCYYNPTGSWLVIQRRRTGDVNFNRDWNEYKQGFGYFLGEFWIGNENLHQITKDGNCQLKIRMLDKDEDGTTANFRYGTVIVGDEASNYALTVRDFDGPDAALVGDSMQVHNNQAFSTYDRDNDKSEINCAAKFRGGWWYNDCHTANLNGLFGSDEHGMGINWSTWTGYNYSLVSTTMMVKCNP